MSSFVYSGDEPRYYPSLGLDVVPGDVTDVPAGIELDARFATSRKTPTAFPRADLVELLAESPPADPPDDPPADPPADPPPAD